MKIVVIGGTGQIGSKLVEKLRHRNYNAVAASPSTGVDIISGNGLLDALAGASVVVDVTNAMVFDEVGAIRFFETAARNIAAAELAVGVRHHVALSVLNSDRLSAAGYIAGKLAQERVVAESTIPYTLVRAAQFFEFVTTIAQASIVDGVSRLSHVHFQPVAADDVAETLAEAALCEPINGIIELAGPDVFRIDELARRVTSAKGMDIAIEIDPDATYFGAPLADDTLLPGPDARIGAISLDAWLAEVGEPVAA